VVLTLAQDPGAGPLTVSYAITPGGEDNLPGDPILQLAIQGVMASSRLLALLGFTCSCQGPGMVPAAVMGWIRT
jgi:hypothetical protein